MGEGRREQLVFAGLVVACFVIAASVSAVIGAVMYAGWMEPGPGHQETCECCP